MSYDGGRPAYSPPGMTNPGAFQGYDAANLPAATSYYATQKDPSGDLVMRNGQQMLRAQVGTNIDGSPVYVYRAPGTPAAAPPAIQSTPSDLLAKLAQGGGTGMGGVVGNNMYAGMLSAPAPAAPTVNPMLQQFLAQLQARQAQQAAPAVQPGSPGMAPLPGVGGGSAYPTSGNSFMSMLQGLKAAGAAPAVPAPAAVSK